MKMGIDLKFRFWVHLESLKTTFSDIYLIGVSKDPTGHILGKESNHCRAQVTESLGSKNTHLGVTRFLLTMTAVASCRVTFLPAAT